MRTAKPSEPRQVGLGHGTGRPLVEIRHADCEGPGDGTGVGVGHGADTPFMPSMQTGTEDGTGPSGTTVGHGTGLPLGPLTRHPLCEGPGLTVGCGEHGTGPLGPETTQPLWTGPGDVLGFGVGHGAGEPFVAIRQLGDGDGDGSLMVSGPLRLELDGTSDPPPPAQATTRISVPTRSPILSILPSRRENTETNGHSLSHVGFVCRASFNESPDGRKMYPAREG